MKSNERLQREVMKALKWELLHNGAFSTMGSELGVTAQNGVITLTGHVDSYPKKIAVEHAAKSVRGVRAMAEEIEVLLGWENQRSDTEIAEDAVNALQWNSAVPHHRITVSVEQGWVILEGTVEWEFQKDEAWREIEDVNGVTGITNLITVQARETSFRMLDNIHLGFQRALSTTWHALRLSN